jgi:hypothetical protein
MIRTGFLHIAVLLLLCGATPALAQTDAPAAERYFHRAAQQYIGENLQAAKRLVAEGLDAHPNHPKLLALRKKLQQQSESNADDGSQQQGESNAQGQQDGTQQQNQSQQGQERGDQGPQQRQSGERGSQSPPDDAAQEGAQNRQDARAAPSQRAGDPSSQRPGELTREQAARILQALQGQEKQLLREVQKRASTKENVEKDW